MPPLSENDKDLVKQLMNHPAWSLLKRKINESAAGYRAMAEQPEVEEHYRLILNAKASGNEEMFGLAEDMTK